MREKNRNAGLRIAALVVQKFRLFLFVAAIREKLVIAAMQRRRRQFGVPGVVILGSAGLGENPVKPYVPRAWHYFFDFLAIECNADQFGS